MDNINILPNIKFIDEQNLDLIRIVIFKYNDFAFKYNDYIFKKSCIKI